MLLSTVSISNCSVPLSSCLQLALAVITQLSFRVWTTYRRTASADPENMDYSVIKAENTKSAPGSYFIPFILAVFLHPSWLRTGASIIISPQDSLLLACIIQWVLDSITPATPFFIQCFPALPTSIKERRGETAALPLVLYLPWCCRAVVLEALCSRPTPRA